MISSRQKLASVRTMMRVRGQAFRKRPSSHSKSRSRPAAASCAADRSRTSSGRLPTRNRTGM